MKRITLIAIFIFVCKCLIAQTAKPNPFAIASKASEKAPENYLAPVIALQAINLKDADRGALDTWYQALITYQSFLGDYKNVLFYNDKRYEYELAHQKTQIDTAFIKGHEFIKAADYLILKAKTEQVMMINEAHHIAYHRAFVISLLKGFYNAGYRYLAIETLEDSLINQKKYPDGETGFYTREPLFGELIREALKIGLKLIVYEPEQECDNKSSDPNYCSNFRDSLMAVNLKNILQKDPNAKILVYAGYDHIYEDNDDGWIKMAQNFKRLTGIDPFTVDLVKQTEHLLAQLNTKEFNAVNRIAHIKEPVVALQNSKPWHGDFVDATVFFPEYLKETARPSFYSLGGLRKPYNLTIIGVKPGQFVQAYYSAEKPGKRIPADQMITSNTGSQLLYMFNGGYEIEVKDKNGTLLKKKTVFIK
nr:hypothetical protein [Mucilaginibacter sp. L294]